ncbi:TIGR01440 family protein [Paenibacillus faecalis]|uniref:TIGR01440 family protein n=1 Tax=Paenibacillus faecalis TaxID=2079532 RepID=UPI000D0EC31C|nr:TIGR01440 family protein [Paenibacillus faecalis]
MTDYSVDHDLKKQTVTIMRELAQAAGLDAGKVLVVGASTSEIIGERIGTAGALETAQQVLHAIAEVQAEFGFDVAYQCCEHLNRALVVERKLLDRLGLTEVAAVPVSNAGGSMATAAYRSFQDPCLAESISAHAGIDIGETMIGMHLRRVAVPFRPSIRYIGKARVTAAFTRPKLIGGERAVYRLEQADDSNACQ